jgi:hypothetical protein
MNSFHDCIAQIEMPGLKARHLRLKKNGGLPTQAAVSGF